MKSAVAVIVCFLLILAMLPASFAAAQSTEIPASAEYTGIAEASEVSWNADGSLLAVGGADGVYLFDTADFNAAPTLIFEGHEISSLAFSPTAPDALAIVPYHNDDWWAAVYDIRTGEELLPLVEARPVLPPEDLAYTQDGNIVAVNDGGELTAVQIDPYARVSGVRPEDYSNGEVAYMGAFTVSVSPDGQWMGAGDVRALIVPMGGGVEDIVALDRGGWDMYLTDTAFSPDSTHFIVGDYSGSLQMWNIATGVRTSFIRGEGASISNTIEAVAFSPDGRTVVTAESNPRAVVRVFTADGLRGVTTFSGGRYAERAKSLAFSPDGTLLAVVFDDTVRILETEGYTQVAELVLARP